MKHSVFLSDFESGTDDDDGYTTTKDTYNSFTANLKGQIFFLYTADLTDGEI